jgi:lipopolysaccharide transport system ATP-binding protein
VSATVVHFDRVWKKFRTGQRHDSLRDLLPATMKAFVRRPVASLAPEEFWALEDVSFEVHQGTALGIIGPNGAGKSTILKLLTRILRPTQGRSSVSGRVGALIEVAAGFHPDLTGRENVYLQGAVMGMKRVEVARRFDEIVDFAGVGAFIDTPIKRYSSGMNARLGFSIAAHLNPEVLIIDEVLSVGDMAFQERCVARMKSFLREGVTVVFVSHNLQAVSDLCHRALFLNRRVMDAGATDRVIEKYVWSTAEAPPARDDLDVTFEQCQLTGDGYREGEPIRPGLPLTLRVRCAPRIDLTDFTLGFLLRRSTDRLVVYDGNVTGDEIGCPTLRPGASTTVDFAFRANVTRGHYFVELHVFHNPSQRFLTRLSPAAMFSVEETRSYDGIANLDLSAVLAAETDPTGRQEAEPVLCESAGSASDPMAPRRESRVRQP